LAEGYRKRPEKTAEAIDADGWLRTGDIATIDDAGYVRIVDRKKELMINAAGKNMSPANIDERSRSVARSSAWRSRSATTGRTSSPADARPDALGIKRPTPGWHASSRSRSSPSCPRCGSQAATK
jgi:hypothetical protein